MLWAEIIVYFKKNEIYNGGRLLLHLSDLDDEAKWYIGGIHFLGFPVDGVCEEGHIQLIESGYIEASSVLNDCIEYDTELLSVTPNYS